VLTVAEFLETFFVRSFRRIWKAAREALCRNVPRAVLTCLGIAIGAATVIAVLDVGQGTALAIQQKVASIGANQIWVEAGSSMRGGVSAGAGTATTLTPQDYEAIVRECNLVRWAAPGVDCRMQVIYRNRNWAPWKVLGTNPQYLLVRNWTDLADGEPFTDSDVLSAAGVCLIGQTPARELFGEASPIGEQVRVNGVLLKVVGLLSLKGANMMGMDQDDIIIAPWTTVKFRINGSKLAFSNLPSAMSTLTQVNTLSQIYPTQQLQLYPDKTSAQTANLPQLMRFPDLNDIFISVTAPEDVPQAIRQITQLLRKRHGLRDDQPADFRIRDMTEISKAFGATTLRLNNWLLGVAVIMLVAGGVGIMNVMLATVTERTREIGLRMAVGARPADILRQFLIEAMTLSLCGGLMGIFLGRGVSIAMSSVLGWPILPSLSTLVVAAAASMGIGNIFGYYPAWRASRLDPIEALRHE
jgi:ABC-type antimicrobial peptide transport system permease subunit